MSKQELFTTGGSGLIGSRLTEVLSDSYKIRNMDLRSDEPIDITDSAKVIQVLQNSDADWVIHMAAMTDVTRAHQENGDTTGVTYHVNVEGTQAILEACTATGKKLLHFSTAYVFDGKKTTPYVETDSPNPIEWYGSTKAQAEELILNAGVEAVIVRIDNPFRTTPFAKPDLVQRIAENLLHDSLSPQFTDSHFGPTYVEDLISGIRWILSNNPSGIFHITNNESWTPFAFARLIGKRMGKESAVLPGSLTAYLQTAPRPYQANTALSSAAFLAKSGLSFSSITQAISSVELPTLH